MYIAIIIATCRFLGIMVPTLMIAVFRKATIGLMEALGFFQNGTLFAEKRMGVTGSGYQRESMTYLTKLPGENECWVSGKVFGFMLLVFEGAFMVLGLAGIIAMKLFF